MRWIHRDGFRLLAFGVVAVVLATVGISACGSDHDYDAVQNPRDPANGGLAPPVPSRLAARVASREVQLTWELSDSTSVAQILRYRIYQRVPSGELSLVDSSDTGTATVRGLLNGQGYFFSASTVLLNGLEGRRSFEVGATPDLFGFTIDDGRPVTNSVSVRLSFQAPVGTAGVRIANDTDPATAPILPYAPTRTWLLPPGDGPKRVHARLVDGAGNSSDMITAEIRLDTRAEIESITFSPTSAVPGQTLRIRLDANEPNGAATARLGNARDLSLRDDGAGGDALADDGVYSLDYVIEEDVELREVLVTAEFVDEAGNSAPERVSTDRLTVHKDPEAVVLQLPTSPGPQSLALQWSQASDAARFSSYRVYRSRIAGVNSDPARERIHETTSRSSTTYTDDGLDPNRTYFYRVAVVDPFGAEFFSNEQSARPRTNDAPEPVVLAAPTLVTDNSVTLTYSQSTAEDFSQYRIYRAEQADVDSDPQRRLIRTVTNRTETRVTDSDELEQNFTYYYQVHVADDLGAVGKSNVVSARILDLPPNAVDLNAPSSVGETTILLDWGINNELDFARYDLRRSTNAGVSPSTPLLVSFTTKEVTSYLDTGLIENTEYFYRLFVVDQAGGVSGSNERRQKTENADPTAVVLAAPTEQTGAATPTLSLTWSQSSVHDFESYRLYRDTAASVSETSTLVRQIDLPNVLAFTDAGLIDNTRYYYRVFVVDDAAGSTGSNEQSVVTANRPPRPVTLNVSGTTARSISLSWTQNTNPDFAEYRLLQGTSSTSFPTVVSSFPQREQNGHTVFVAEGDSTVYFFKVETYDQSISSSQRLKTDSNVVSARAE